MMHKPGSSDSLAKQSGATFGGLQFALTVVLFAYAGWWIDEQWDTKPWLFICGCLIGSVGGFYHLYRTLVSDSPKADRKAPVNGTDQKNGEEEAS